ncbi:MAG: methyltransferase domain-containing protein [Candidatus Aenigmarchaeota archaeon]|nr:methyltransferase domain-containing protein [Candidatus Aenigmarchaeota archaeon]
MNPKILKYLVCPTCREPLKLKSEKMLKLKIKESTLVCRGSHKFKIKKFVPRLLRGRINSLQKQTGESFAKKWGRQPWWGLKGGTKSFFRKWFLERYGWNDEKTFKKFISSKEMILDAGTGLGREVVNCCKFTKGEVFGVEISDCVENAYVNTKDYPNAHIIQADITRLPFEKNMFDFILSEGVLHHTPDTKKSFEYLVPYLKKRGEIAIYVYKKKGPIREFCDERIRKYTTKLSAEKCWEFCKRFTKLGKSLSELDMEIEVPDNLPQFKIEAGKYDLQRFIYWNALKCFWNADLSFDENNLVNFDWYHPKYAHRHSLDEVKRWFKESGLKIAHFHVDNSGITARGVK